VQVSLLYANFHCFRYMPRSGVARSLGSSTFSFLWNLHTKIHNNWIHLPSHQQCMGDSPLLPMPLHAHQHLMLFVFLVTAILTGVRWNLSVIFTCISFMPKGCWTFFMYLLDICTSFENCLFNSFDPLLIGLFVLLVLIFGALQVFWILTLYPMNNWQFFFHSVGGLLISEIISFTVQNLLLWCSPTWQFLLLFLSNWSPIQKGITYASIFNGFPYVFH
jgi:hypothetical protein